MSTTASSRSFSLAAAAMATGGLALLAAAGLLALRQPEPAQSPPMQLVSCEDRCALPAGIHLDDVSQDSADYIARRAQLCADLECSRIDAKGYADAIAELDTKPPTPLPERMWATAVREVSSQYGEDDWSASQALGAPNVFPSSGDNVKAWASLNADSAVEFIEVAVPVSRISGVEVYESFNPGAIRSIDLIAANGTRSRVATIEPRYDLGGSRIAQSEFSCTDDKIVGVRVTLNAASVTGWNEIDAIAVRPCR